MYALIGYGGLTALALLVAMLYFVLRQPPWSHHLVTGGFAVLFGIEAWKAWRDRRAWKVYEEAVRKRWQDAPGAWGVVLSVLGGALLCSAVAAWAMTCTTHTYYVDGRYVTCQTCCTNGHCTTTCF